MRHRFWSLLAVGLFLVVGGTSQAQDIVRLGGATAQADLDGGADTAFVRWGRGGYYGGGYRGGYGYGYGYRSYYAGYGYYRPYYRGYYGVGYGYYPPVSYYQPYIYYSAPAYYYPISGSAAPTVQTKASYSEPLPPPGAVRPMPAAGGTFDYDGGPRNPAPLPGPGYEFSPAKQLRSIVPIEGKLASLPTETMMGSLLLTAAALPSPAPSARQTGYAAYGEDPVAAPVRKR